MSLSLSPVYSDMVRQFTTSAGSTRFTEDFVSAVNSVLDDLYANGCVTSVATHVGSYTETLTDLSAQHTSAFKKMLTYYLVLGGQKHSGLDLPAAMDLYEDGKGDMIMLMTRDDAADRDDDDVPETDIVDLGYLGSL